MNTCCVFSSSSTNYRISVRNCVRDTEGKCSRSVATDERVIFSSEILVRSVLRTPGQAIERHRVKHDPPCQEEKELSLGHAHPPRVQPNPKDRE